MQSIVGKDGCEANRQGVTGKRLNWQPLLLHIALMMVLASLAGCLESFTRATNQPPTTRYEAGGEEPKGDIPTPHLFDFNFKLSED